MKKIIFFVCQLLVISMFYFLTHKYYMETDVIISLLSISILSFIAGALSKTNFK